MTISVRDLINVDVDLDEIKGTGWDSTTDTLHGIRQDAGEVNNSIVYSRFLVEENVTENTEDHLYNNLTLVGTAGAAYLNAGTKNVIVQGDLVMKSSRITCANLEVYGDITVIEKVADTYQSLFDVDRLICHGDLTMDNVDWQADSTEIQKIEGDASLTDVTEDIFNCKFYVGGNLTSNIATISHLGTHPSCFQTFVGGNCTFSDLTSIDMKTGYPLSQLYVGGTLTFGEAAVSIDVSGSLGSNGSGFQGGLGGIWEGGLGANNPTGASGSPGHYLGGGGGAGNQNITSSFGGGSGAHTRAGVGGAVNVTVGWPAAGGGGGSSPQNLDLYYNIGDADTTLTINSNGGNGGNASSGGGACTGNGGNGGSGGIISVRYGSTQISTVRNVAAGSGGTGANGGSAGSAGSAGSSSDSVGAATTWGIPPIQPTLVTEDGVTTSTLTVNIPVDSDGDDLDICIEIDERYTNRIWYATLRQDSFNNAGSFSGSPPYTEGTGTAVYTPSGLTAGTTYRWRAVARKRVTITADTNTSTTIDNVSDADIWKKVCDAAKIGGTNISGTDIPASTTVTDFTGNGPGYLEGVFYISQAATGTSAGVTLTLSGKTSNYGFWAFDSTPSEWREFIQA